MERERKMNKILTRRLWNIVRMWYMVYIFTHTCRDIIRF